MTGLELKFILYLPLSIYIRWLLTFIFELKENGAYQKEVLAYQLNLVVKINSENK